MPRYTLELSDAAARVIGSEISAGRQSSVEAFFEELLREEQARRDYLDALIDEGFESGPPIPVDEEFWAERRRKLESMHRPS